MPHQAGMSSGAPGSCAREQQHLRPAQAAMRKRSSSTSSPQPMSPASHSAS